MCSNTRAMAETTSMQLRDRSTITTATILKRKMRGVTSTWVLDFANLLKDILCEVSRKMVSLLMNAKQLVMKEAIVLVILARRDRLACVTYMALILVMTDQTQPGLLVQAVII